jgi:hypothetical protein
MRRASLVPLACACLLAGCGSEEESAPDACLAGPGEFRQAVASAPAGGTLSDGTAISDCLVEDQPAGELSRLGVALVGAAEPIGAAAREEPGGRAAFRLGYLVGAVQRGAEETGGVHADLVRRLQSIAASGAPPPASGAAYGRGLAAGREGG